MIENEDFVMELPRLQRGYDSIWVIVDILMKLAHFLPIRATNFVNILSRLYIREIVIFHGVPVPLFPIETPDLLLSFGRV